MPEKDISGLEEALKEKGIEVITEREKLQDYITLERGKNGDPLCAIKPKNETELQTVIKQLNHKNIGAVLIAGRTGLVSAQRAQQEAVIDMSMLNQLHTITLKNGNKLTFSKRETLGAGEDYLQWQKELEVWIKQEGLKEEDFHDAIIECDAGVAVGSVNEVLKPAGIEIPMHTGAVSIGGGMTVGGGAANATHGNYGVLYGTFCDLVVKVFSINGDGTEQEEQGPKYVVQRIIPEDKLVINSAEPQYGYSALGTQGTFSVITKVAVRTSPIPKQQHVFMIKTDNMEEINTVRQQLQKAYPGKIRQVEVMNRAVLDMIHKEASAKFFNVFDDGTGEKDPIDANNVAMIEIVDSERADEEDSLLFGVMAFFEKLGYGDSKQAYSGSATGNAGDFLKMRHAASELSAGYTKEGLNKHRVSTDTSVPLNQLDAYVKTLTNRLEEKGCRLNIFGHVGIGALHIHTFTDRALSDQLEPDKTVKQDIIRTIYETTIKFGGTPWSEHGVGTANAEYFRESFPEVANRWFAYKLNSDCKDILSPHSNAFNDMFDELHQNEKRQKRMLEKVRRFMKQDHTLDLKKAETYLSTLIKSGLKAAEKSVEILNTYVSQGGAKGRGR